MGLGFRWVFLFMDKFLHKKRIEEGNVWSSLKRTWFFLVWDLISQAT